ncbi:MAG: enoyl-CoA hydratase [Deltaproteobacteria bacterium]|nr:enoyl-CoA hydratase [Deltaproteobacteria bacterium]
MAEILKYEHIIYEEREKIALLTLNRPEKRNGLSLELLEEFSACLKHVAQERSAKVVIVKGAGHDFCAGHDMKEILNKELNEIRNLFQACLDLMMLIHAIPQPVIAQVHGIATAAGCQLVAACDLAVAEEGAQFATPGVKIGLFCFTPMVPLSRAVGRKKALEMLLTGENISATEARSYGLVNRVVSKKKLEEETWRLAKDIAKYSLVTLGLGKEAFYHQIEMAERQAYHYAKELISANALMADAREGMAAFFEKRLPIWKEK